MNDNTYNGWPNRETWAAALMLSNDAETDAHAHRVARAAYDAAITAEGLDATHLPNVQRADIADALEAIVDYIQAVALGYWGADGCAAPFDKETARAWTLEVGSLWRVEWRDIAEGYRETFDAEGEAA